MTRTYADMTEQLGLEPFPELVDVPVNWPSTKRFLKDVAVILDPSLESLDQPLWARIYRTNIAARNVGHRLHLRVPSRFLKLDRVVVLAGVAGIPNSIPLRKQAFDWARR